MKTPSPSAGRGKTLIVHVGDHKTGSTSIQNAFASGRVTLPGHSVLYPGNLDHNYLSEHVTKLAKGGPLPAGRPGMPGLERIAARLAESDADFCLLSGESFEGVAPEALQMAIDKLLAPHVSDIRIVAYIRPHAGRILSTYSEQTKIGWFQGDPVEMFQRTLKSERFCYAPRLRRWREVFGARFIARPMVRDVLHNRSVVDDFVQTAFDGLPFRIAPGDSGNESLSLEDLMLIKHVHAHLTKVNKGARLGFGWEIAQRLSAAGRPEPATRLSLHRTLARRIRKAYLADARAIDAEFFDGHGLFAGDLKNAVETALSEPQSCNPEDYFSTRELRDIAVLADTMAGMLGRDQLNWPLWFRTRRAESLSDTV